MHRKTLAIFNFIGLICALIVNGLATSLPLNKTDLELSNQYPNLFVPAPLTFSIWGVIYLLLFGFIGYSLYVSFTEKKEESRFIEIIGPLFFISCMANSCWILVWHLEFVGTSLLVMIILLTCLIKIYHRLNVARSNAPFKERFFTQIPFAVYLGWISIATIANTTAILVAYGWDGFGIPEPIWAAIMISVGLSLGILFLMKNKDVYFASVIIWAYIGILLQRWSIDPSYDMVTINAIIGIVFLSILGLFQGVRGIMASRK